MENTSVNSNNDILTIKKLSKIYHTNKSEIPAIKDLNLNIKEGEFVAIVGPSGCGKTTLLSICYSLGEYTMPTDIPIIADSNVEMSWFTFAGEYSDVYDALMKAWCLRMGLPIDEETLAKYFR